MGAVLISCIGTDITASGLYWWTWFHKDLTPLRNDLILTDSTYLIFEVIQMTCKLVDPHVCVSSWQHCTVSRFLKFLLCSSGSYLTPSLSYEAQREAISDFGWLERFRAMFTVTNETDMLIRNPKASLSTFCDLRDTTPFFSLILSRVQAGRCQLYDISKWSGDLSHINHQHSYGDFHSPKLFM